ncbi:MAG: hypothetical protein ABJP34_08945 [Erythrobacter sp.]
MKKLFGVSVIASLALTACNAAENATAEEVGSIAADTAEETVVGVAAYDKEAPSAASSEPVVDETALEEDADKDFAARNPVARPVQYGVDGPNLDACSGVGKVSGLKADGDGFLAVRAEPNMKAFEADRIKNDQTVFFCEEDGPWIGVVYDKSGKKDCGTGSPIPEPTTYVGPCDSGWVDSRYLTLIAG